MAKSHFECTLYRLGIGDNIQYGDDNDNYNEMTAAVDLLENVRKDCLIGLLPIDFHFWSHRY